MADSLEFNVAHGSATFEEWCKVNNKRTDWEPVRALFDDLVQRHTITALTYSARAKRAAEEAAKWADLSNWALVRLHSDLERMERDK